MSNIICPICKSEMIHIQEVKVNRGGEVTIINKNGTKLISTEPSGRGALINIFFWCESGHLWRQSFQFYKGETTSEVKKEDSGCHLCSGSLLSDLWRD